MNTKQKLKLIINSLPASCKSQEKVNYIFRNYPRFLEIVETTKYEDLPVGTLVTQIKTILGNKFGY